MSKRISLSVVEKVELLKNVDSGIRRKGIAVRFGVPPSTVSTIIKNREFIMKTSEDVVPHGKRFKMCHLGTVGDVVLKWNEIILSSLFHSVIAIEMTE